MPRRGRHRAPSPQAAVRSVCSWHWSKRYGPLPFTPGGRVGQSWIGGHGGFVPNRVRDVGGLPSQLRVARGIWRCCRSGPGDSLPAARYAGANFDQEALPDQTHRQVLRSACGLCRDRGSLGEGLAPNGLRRAADQIRAPRFPHTLGGWRDSHQLRCVHG